MSMPMLMPAGPVRLTLGPMTRLQRIRRRGPLGLAAVMGFLGAVSGIAYANHTFPDVGTGSAFHTEVANARGAGIVTGFSDGTFRPRDPINRQQVAGWLNRTGGRVDTGEGTTSTFTFNTLAPLATASITSGAVGGSGGFVVLTGNVRLSTTDTSSCPCVAGLTIVDDATSENSGPIATDIPHIQDDTGQGRTTVSYTWVRPIPPNVTRTYSLAMVNLDANVASIFGQGVITAIYVPFAGDGGNTL
jgi:hypothetical protein